MGYTWVNSCLDARKVEESHHPTPKATTTTTPRRKATSREDKGKRGLYLTDSTYGLSAYTNVYVNGLTAALNGKLCPPPKITLPDTTVPGTAEKPVNGPLHST